MAPEQQDANQAALTAEWSVALEKEAPAEGATAAAGAEKPRVRRRGGRRRGCRAMGGDGR